MRVSYFLTDSWKNVMKYDLQNHHEYDHFPLREKSGQERTLKLCVLWVTVTRLWKSDGTSTVKKYLIIWVSPL